MHPAARSPWGTLSHPEIICKNSETATSAIYLDDIRLQPSGSQMNSYVYDTRTLHLLTSFDDQHFGMYYQYNTEGKLIRKLIETERGIKTLEEAQYHIPAVSRN